MNTLLGTVRPVTGLTVWDDMDRMIERTFGSWFDDLSPGGTATPAVDVRETEKEYVVEADLPGLNEKDVEVKIDNKVLSISARHDEEKKEDGKDYLIRERRAASWFRSFVLPDNVDREKVEAVFTNGVLRLTIGKQPEAVPKTIEIRKN